MSQVAATSVQSRPLSALKAAASRPADHHACAFAREAPRDRLAHVIAPCGAQDHRDLAL